MAIISHRSLQKALATFVQPKLELFIANDENILHEEGQLTFIGCSTGTGCKHNNGYFTGNG